jgi:hypothetical protein
VEGAVTPLIESDSRRGADPELQKGRITRPFSLGQGLAGTVYRIVALGAAEADETDFLGGLGHDLGTVKGLASPQL